MLINIVMKKYGIECFRFEVIATCLDPDAANDAEELIIQQEKSHVSFGTGYNVSAGGATAPRTAQWRRKISASAKKRFAQDKNLAVNLKLARHNYIQNLKRSGDAIPCGFQPGRNVSVAVREKLRAATTGRIQSKNEIEKRIQSLQAYYATHSKEKRTLTKEQKDKISIAVRERHKLTSEQKNEIIEKSAYCSKNSLAKEYNVSYHTIKRLIERFQENK